MNQLVSEIEHRIAYRFRDEDLPRVALTHRSAGGRHNERLEYLGDAALNFAIAAELYRRFPRANEGELSRMRASLVRGETLAEVAAALDLGDILSLGTGELKSGGFRRESILADALEAVIGAVYLDGGHPASESLVLRLFAERLEQVDPKQVHKDPKTRLQEFLQSRGNPLPVYEVVSVEGKDHKQTFHVRCVIQDSEAVGEGKGVSRRKAEQQAANNVLLQLTS